MHATLDREHILSALTCNARSNLSILELHASLDSTNTYLMQRAQEHWPSGAACFAEQQTAGRGRQGRSWVSPRGSNLAYSLLWRFTQPATQLSGLSLAVGIATAQVLRAAGIADIGLKWPNDLWWQRRKLGGILLESGSSGGTMYVVAGVGINLHLPMSEATHIEQPWVDLHSIPNMPTWSRNQLAAALLSNLIEMFDNFAHSGFSNLATLWAEFDCIAGQPVMLQLPHSTVSGYMRGVDNRGALLLENAAGQIQPYLGGEIRLKILP